MPNPTPRPVSVALELEDLASMYDLDSADTSTARHMSALEAERDAAVKDAAEARRQMASMRGA